MILLPVKNSQPLRLWDIMSKKILKVSFPEKCIGCDMCVFAAQRALGRVGFEGAPIRILKSDQGFLVHLDFLVSDLDIKDIARVCPTGVFTIEDAPEGQDPELAFSETDDGK